MSDLDFEAYLNLLSRFLRLNRGQREEIRRELRAHLEAALDDADRRGEPRANAILRVLDDFGDAAELAAAFSSLEKRKRWIMRGTAMAACVALVVVALQMAGPNTVQTVTAQSESHRAAAAADTASVDAALARVIPDINYQDVPLADALEAMRGLLGVNMIVRWNLLEQQGVARDKPITLSLKNVKAERVLRLVLDEAADGANLAYEADENILMIAPREAFQRALKVRFYDVRDLLELDGSLPAEASNRLTRFVTQTVEPESWNVNGGIGSIEIFAGVAGVRQSDDVHDELQRMLEVVRKYHAGDAHAGNN